MTAPSNEMFWRFLERRETLDFYFGNAFRIPVIFHLDLPGLAQRRLIRLTSLIGTLPWDRRLPLISAGSVTAILSAEELSVPGLERVAGLRGRGNRPFFLYRNSTAAPRAAFVSTSAFVSSETDAVKAVLSRGFDPREVRAFIEKYGITYWLVDQPAFTRQYVMTSIWIQQTQPHAARVAASLEQPTLPVVAQLSLRCQAYSGRTVILLNAACLKSLRKPPASVFLPGCAGIISRSKYMAALSGSSVRSASK